MSKEERDREVVRLTCRIAISKRWKRTEDENAARLELAQLRAAELRQQADAMIAAAEARIGSAREGVAS